MRFIARLIHQIALFISFLSAVPSLQGDGRARGIASGGNCVQHPRLAALKGLLVPAVQHMGKAVRHEPLKIGLHLEREAVRCVHVVVGLHRRGGRKRDGEPETRWDTDLGQFYTHGNQRGQRTAVVGLGLGECDGKQVLSKRIVSAAELQGLPSAVLPVRWTLHEDGVLCWVEKHLKSPRKRLLAPRRQA